MNKVLLIGRLIADPNVRSTKGGDSVVATYTIAVDRIVSGEKSADFIRCVAFGKSAEVAEKYLVKGMKIAVTGSIKTGSYENENGDRVYTTDIWIETQEFVESKKSESDDTKPAKKASNSRPKQIRKNQKRDDDGFMNIPDGIDDEIPFN